MGAGAERIAVAIDVTKDTDAIGQTVQEVNAATAQVVTANQRVVTAAEQQSEQIAKANAGAIAASAGVVTAERSKATAATQSAAVATTAAAQRTAAERAVQSVQTETAALTRQQRIDAQNAINTDISLLQLKSRALDVTSQAAVRDWMEEARSIREAVAAEGEQERALLQIDLAMKSVTNRVAAMEAAQDRVWTAGSRANQTIAGVPDGKLRMGAQAASTLAFSLSGVGGTAKEAAFALGNVAQVISLMTNTARIAAWSAGIGAAVTVFGSLVGLIQDANKAINAPDSFVNRLQNWNVHVAETQLESLRARAEALRKEIEQGNNLPTVNAQMPGGLSVPLPSIITNTAANKRDLADYRVLLKEIEDAQKHVDELQTSENKTLRDSNRQLQIQAAGQLAAARAQLGVRQIELRIAQDRLSTIALGSDKERADAKAALEDHERQIRQQFTIRDSTGAIVALTADQRKQREALLAIARADYELQLKSIAADQLKAEDLRLRAQTAYQAQTTGIRETGLDKQYAVRVAQIYEEGRVAEEQGMRKVDVERRVQAEIRKLQRDTFQQSIGYLGQFSQVLIASKSREVKAVGMAADTVRRLLIGADGAHSAVLAIKEGAAAIASAAAGDFGGAALHAASSVQFAAAAALAAQESLGGGRTASGGGGAGAASQSTFEPTGATGGGNVTINLITRDPYGKDSIAETVFQLQQFGDLKRTIPISSTRGVLVGGVS